MVADIRIKTSFLGHRKRKKLIKLLGAGATDYILDLWLRTALERPDGAFSGMDALDIALMAGWPGDPEKFCEDLQLAGFLDMRADRVFVLHDWAEHQPWVVGSEERRSSARKAANIRHHGSAEGKHADHAGQGAAGPGAQKMPEEGSKSALTMQVACAPHMGSNAGGIQAASAPHTGSNAPSLSSSSTLKGKKTPPERATALSSPGGGERTGEAKRFSRPTLEQVARYCTERGNGIDPQVFMNHYTANGWRIGKSPMKDWKAAVRTWEAKRLHDQKAQEGTLSAAAKLRALTAQTNGETS